MGPQGFATPLHVHRDVDEGFYVIEGELTVWAGDDVTVLNAGDFVLAPRGVPHTIKNTAAGDTRVLVTSTPAGFEDFVRAYGTLAPTRELPVLDGPPTSHESQHWLQRTASTCSALPGCCPPS